MNKSQRTLGVFTMATLLGVALPVCAAPNAQQKQLMARRSAQRYQTAGDGRTPGSGGAHIAVKAPAELVRRTVTDFKSYPEFISKFEKAHVVGRSGNNTDVYLQVPILKGAAKIWAVLRFEPPKAADGAEIIDAHLVKGNVKRLDARFRILKIDDENTELDLNMTIVPDLPIPESLITDEASYASDVAVTGSRDRAERNYAAAKKK